MPLRTLTKKEFLAKKPKGSYAKYKAHIGAARKDYKPPKKATPMQTALAPDPFAPMSETALRTQASQSVRTSIEPIIAQIRASLGADETRRVGAINANTDIYAQQQEKYAGRQKEIDDSFRASLVGEAAKSQSSLANAIAGIDGGPAAMQHATDVGAQGANAADAVGVKAQADQSFLASLPGLARLTGQHAANAVRTETQKSIGEKTGELTSRIPEMIESLLNSGRDREYNKAVAAAGFKTDTAKAKSDVQIARMEAQAKIKEAKDDRDFARELARMKFQQSQQTATDKQAFDAEMKAADQTFTASQNALTRAANARLAREKDARKESKGATKIDTQRSKVVGFLVNGKGQFVDQRGVPIPKKGKKIVKNGKKVTIHRVPVAKSDQGSGAGGGPDVTP